MMDSASKFKILSAELGAKLLRRLRYEWEAVNWALFDSRMRAPILELSEGRVRLGQWNPDGRRLSLSRDAILAQPWGQTLEVLKHEMAHQFVDEVLGGEPRPHGPKFRRVCEARGIDATAAGAMRGAPIEPGPEDKIIERVRKLLALAESANQHEAELAASTAQRIMLKYNLEVGRRPDGDAPRYLLLGRPTGRVPVHERMLAELLTEHFFVRGIWIPVYRPLEGKTGTVLEICGRPENLQMAEFVHGFMLRTIERLWEEHKVSVRVRSNRDRRAFLFGAVAGFDSKLREKQLSAREEGLVWSGDAAVDDYLKRRHPRMRTVSYPASQDGAAYAAGCSAGRSIVLSRPVPSSTPDHHGPRALPPSRSGG